MFLTNITISLKAKANLISLFHPYLSFHHFIPSSILHNAQIFHTKEHKNLKSFQPTISFLLPQITIEFTKPEHSC